MSSLIHPRLMAFSLAAGLLGVAHAAELSALSSVRVSGLVTVQRGGESLSLKARERLVAGDRLELGSDSHAALQLGREGLISLAPGSELAVYDTEAARPGLPALAKLKLLGGALRVESTAAGRGLPQDIRLNVGGLKTRVYGSSVFASQDKDSAMVCVLAGAVEIQSAQVGDHRLDQPGDCLQLDSKGESSTASVSADAAIVARIAATEFDTDVVTALNGAPLPPPPPIVLRPTTPAAPHTLNLSVPSASRPTPPPAPPKPALKLPVPVAPLPPPPPPRPAKPAAPEAPATSGAWTVVVVSLNSPSQAEARLQSLQDQGFAAQTRNATVGGKQVYRVTIGSFESRQAAQRYARSTLAKAGLNGWVAPL